MRLALPAVLALCGCPQSSGGFPRPDPEPSVAQVVDRLSKARDALVSFKTTTDDSTMDYRFDTQRAKVSMLVMATVGSKLRLALLSPAGGSTIAEMACDGTNFAVVNYQNNCVMSGPCDSHSIERFIHLDLAPDDFLHLALGTMPVMATTTGTVTWDGSAGYERVELSGAEGTQTIAIDARDNHWDVVSSELVSPDGKVRWSVENKGYVEVKGPSATYRIPTRTWFKSPIAGNDVIVEWRARDVNVTIDPKKFELTLPQGLPMCGQQPPGATGGNAAGGASSPSSSHPRQIR